MTWHIDLEAGGTLTATSVTNVSYPAGEVTFYGSISGVVQQWTFMANDVKEIRQ